MDQEYKEFIAKRCERALQGNPDYIKILKECVEAIKKNDIMLYSDLVGRLQSLSETECYRKGFIDACTHFVHEI